MGDSTTDPAAVDHFGVSAGRWARIQEPAPAKINLWLHVGPPEGDGRHPLDSLVMFADHGDRLAVVPAPADRPSGSLPDLSVSGRFSAGLATGEDNLVLRAAAALRAAAMESGRGACGPVHLHLEKNLPVASGIGGGSADAAATLRALNRFWQLGFSLTDLARIAARLGADVPACVANRTAHMTGTGEQLAPATAPALHAVLANGLAPVPTGPVYRRFDAINGYGPPSGGSAVPAFIPTALPNAGNVADFIAALRAFRNDLEPAACAIEPAIGPCLDALRGLPDARLIRMSGSGGTCFALFETAAQAERAAQILAQAQPEWWSVACRFGHSEA